MPDIQITEAPEELKAELEKYAQLIQEKAKMPDWWMKYAGQIAYNLQVHTKGLMFDKITGLYPNEHPDSQKHCINSYESITKGSIWKAINNIIRVFNNSSFSVQTSKKTEEVITEYSDTEGSFFSQFLEDWIKYAVAADPNGICVWYPPDYTDDLYRYVCHKDLIKVSEDVLIFISEKESEIQVEFVDKEYTKEVFFDLDYEIAPGIPNTRHGVVRTFNRRIENKMVNPVYHVFTKTHFIRFYKKDRGDKEFLYEYFEHPKELDTLPYYENGGVEIEKDLYESFIQPFVPFGNLALVAHRNQRAVELMFYYPRISEVQQPCDECHGTGYMDKAHNELCKVCKGSKYITVQSPYKVYRKVHDSFDTDGKVFSTPSVEFYSPDTGILTLVQKQWIGYLEQGEEAVFVQQRQDTGQVEAAKSKQLDQEGLFAWLSNISKVLYGNLEMGLQYLENYVNPSPIKVSVERPYSFAILTESEAFKSLTTMLISNAPVLLKASQIDNFVNKFISESSPVKRALSILKKYDPLLYYSDETLASFKGLGAISGKQLIQHIYAYPVLIQLYEKDKNIFDVTDGSTPEQADEQIIKMLSKEIEKYDLTKDLRTAILNPLAVSA